MRLLILGGTAFLGRTVAALARDAGHAVTCAARGASGTVAPGVEFVKIDRDDPDGLSALAGREFDAVVDVASKQSHVRHAVTTLADRVGHWTFVSTCNVYADQATPGQRADTAALAAETADDAVDTVEGYGGNKVAAENAVRAALGDRAFICRAGLIIGPGDGSGRFGYWVRRLAEAGSAGAAGEVLAPGDPDDAVQTVDVRDLADWILRAAGSGLAGEFDGIGAPTSRAQFLERIAAGLGMAPRFTWVSGEFLTEKEVNPWGGKRSLPLWLPLPEYAGFLSRDVAPSLAAGLRTRDIAETARDTLGHEGPRDIHPADDGVPGITREEERELLAAWHARA